MYWAVGAGHWAWDNNARFGVLVGECLDNNEM